MHFDVRRSLAAKVLPVILICLYPVWGQCQIGRDLNFSSSPDPVGSGARAVGRGGAFIAIADDATAASWNPAGLIQLDQPEVSVAGTWFARSELIDFASSSLEAEDGWKAQPSLNYASAAYATEALPVYLVLAVNYQRLYEFDRDLRVDYTGEGFSGSARDQQAGVFSTISPALAVEINYRFSLGVSVNIWNHSLSPNGWDQRTKQRESGVLTLGSNSYPYTYESEKEEKYRLEGNNLNYNIGFLWDINDVWRVGGVYKTELIADVTHQQRLFRGQYFITNAGFTDIFRGKFDYDEKLHLPPAYGIGLAFQPSDEWSFALDVYRTEWNRFFLEDEDGTAFNLISGQVESSRNVDPTTQVRLGMEYLWVRGQVVYPFRAGIFYDPEPRVGPPRDVYGASFGTGMVRDPLVLDAACQLRWGPTVNRTVVVDESSEQEFLESIVMVSMIYHFQ